MITAMDTLPPAEVNNRVPCHDYYLFYQNSIREDENTPDNDRRVPYTIITDLDLRLTFNLAGNYHD